MKARIKRPYVENARGPEKKEIIETLNVVAIHKGELINAITARFYMGRSNQASVVYCCLWVRGRAARNNFYCSGYGTAGGYGYHKTSAALQDAISSAGIELFGSPYGEAADAKEGKHRAHIGGCGDNSMLLALEAITRAAGYRGKLMIMRG